MSSIKTNFHYIPNKHLKNKKEKMKTHIIETKTQTNPGETEQTSSAITELLLLLYQNRAVTRNRNTDPASREKIIKELLTGSKKKDPHTYDMWEERHLSVGYKFGEHTLAQYPDYTARGDKRSSLDKKIKNLTAIGLAEGTLRTFRELADPEWGFTFKGVRIDHEGVHFQLDRRQTYNPFRQLLLLHVDNQGKLSWEYEFDLYNPKNLSFWKPNDTMGVNTPEFRSQPYVETPVCIKGSVARNGNLEFNEITFGGVNYTYALPNYTVKSLSKSRILLHQTTVWGINGQTPHTDFEIASVSFRKMIQFITQPDYEINTNPLLRVKTLENRMSKKTT